MGSVYADVKTLHKELDKMMPNIEPKVREQLYMLMDYEGHSILSRSDYETIVTPWASFSATDVNDDNELDISELKTLLWLNYGKEPSNLKLQSEMKLIDSDGSGTIDRLEFIKYLVSPDSECGAEYFDFELRKAFDRIDIDGDGRISNAEFVIYLREQMAPLTSKIIAKDQKKMDAIFLELARECSLILSDKDLKDNIPWQNFKRFNSVCLPKMSSTTAFVKNFFDL
jgi:Ca2+-binding EF-hand superfamily protein